MSLLRRRLHAARMYKRARKIYRNRWAVEYANKYPEELDWFAHTMANNMKREECRDGNPRNAKEWNLNERLTIQERKANDNYESYINDM